MNKVDNKGELVKLWNKVFGERRKIVSIERAMISANATVYAECLKQFGKKEQKAIKKKTARDLMKESINENKGEYRAYKIEDNVIMFSPKEKILKDFPEAERSGIIKNVNNEFEMEMILKAKDLYDIKLSPNLFFVINGD